MDLTDVSGAEYEAYIRLVLGRNEALRKLAQRNPRQAELVKLRFFAGLTTAEAAKSLGVSVSTAENDWAYARCWLRLEMAGRDFVTVGKSLGNLGLDFA